MICVVFSVLCSVLVACSLRLQKNWSTMAQVSPHIQGRKQSSTGPTLGLTKVQETSERCVALDMICQDVASPAPVILCVRCPDGDNAVDLYCCISPCFFPAYV